MFVELSKMQHDNAVKTHKKLTPSTSIAYDNCRNTGFGEMQQ
jgi:hypothetical protein